MDVRTRRHDRAICHLEFLKFESYAVIDWDIGIALFEKRRSCICGKKSYLGA